MRELPAGHALVAADLERRAALPEAEARMSPPSRTRFPGSPLK
jgi:hypothetical protein